MSAVFSTPVAAVLLAVELLLFEWKPRSFVPVALASAAAGTLRIYVLGAEPLFPVAAHGSLPAYLTLFAFAAGIAAGALSGALTKLVYAFEDFFPRLRLHWMWWPAIGGAAVGVIGLVEPRVLGVGYELIGSLLRGDVPAQAAASILICKALAWSFALGSGTSGGVLAPLLMLGGCLGALEAGVIPGHDRAVWAAVSMAAVMGGTMRAPLTAMVFALELTHDIGLLPLLMAACVGAHAFTVLVLPRSILTEKVARRGHHITREYSVDTLALARVREVMDREIPSIAATVSARELAERISRHDPLLSRRQATVLLDGQGLLAGIITRGDLVGALADEDASLRSVLECGTPAPLVVCYPDELLREVIGRMLANDVGRLPVVDRDDARRVVGYLGRASLLAAEARRFEEENVREATLGPARAAPRTDGVKGT
jgi:CBS domain-containing protein